MTDKRLDEFFKQSFSGYTPDVPPHIWENIVAGKKKKRPAAFWLNKKRALWLAAGMLLFSGVAYFAFEKNKTVKNIALEKNSSRQETGNTAPAAVLQTNPDIPGNDTATASSSTSSGQRENVLETNAAETPASADRSVVNTNSANSSSPSFTSNQTPGFRPVGSAKNSHRRHLYINTNSTYSTIATAKEPVAEDGNSMDNYSEVLLPFIGGDRNLPLLPAENNLPKPSIKPFTPLVNISEECPGAPTNKYYFDFYISPDYAVKKYNDTASSSLVSRRKESMRFHSAFSAGMRYTRVFNNGMSVRTGINFSQINEKFSYAKDNVVQIIYVINNQGDTTDSYYVRGTRYKTSYNHYRTIDVPLLVGYEMGNDKWRANINTGAIVNIYSWQKGETLDVDGNPVEFTTGKPENPYQYKTNVGVGFTAGASLYYKLNNRTYALAEPYFRYNFSPMNKEAFSIQERFTTIGLRLGIRVDIK